MADIVNLRMARKQRDRRERERIAGENRARHGVAKAVRETTARQAESEIRRLDGHRREKPGEGGAD